jgi:hypothetical protein
MRAQSDIISVVIIAGIIIALVGAAYVWAVPMIEKRITLTDYSLIENFALELDQAITNIANTASGEERIPIPRGAVEVKGFDFSGPVNNTLTIDFTVSQPIMTQGAVPIKTSSIDDVAEYGNAEPRIIMLSRYPGGNNHLNMTMKYRELRSTTPKGYMIALCPVTGPTECGGEMTGGNEVVVRYKDTVIQQRDSYDGGPLTITYVEIEII